MNKVKRFFRSLFEKDSTLKIMSIVAAVLIWMIVSINVYPTMDTIIYNVPVEINLEGSYAQSNQLDVMSSSVKTVNVEISGERGKIGDIKTSDLIAVADVSQVIMAKDYKLSLNIESLKSKDFDVISIDPPTVNVSFDKIITKEFPVEAQLDNVKIASGFMMGDPVVSPETVTVTGPQDMINTITKVKAVVSIDRELNAPYDFTSTKILLYNNNAIISNNDGACTFDKTSFTVQIPVFVRQTIPLDVNIINVPDKFDIMRFRESLQFSVSELDIAAPNDKIREIPSLSIGTINMREADIGEGGAGSVFQFRTEDFLPEGYENLSQVDIITVTCPGDDLEKKAIAIKGSSIQLVNVPARFDFDIITSGFTPFFVGDAEQIESLTRADITAQIDLIDFDMQEGDHKLPVEFIISDYDYVWVVGTDVATPKAYVTASLRTETEDEE